MARYYRADIEKYKPVSTEITGYFASIMVYLYSRTGDDEYLNRAILAARFLCDKAWDESLRTFPFEFPAERAFFFDCGIIVRGLLAVWRVTGEQRLLDVAVAAAHGMTAFRAGAELNPILLLPDKRHQDREPHWSRSPGCYQLKSALAWLEVSTITGDERMRDTYFETLESALQSHHNFLPGTPNAADVMDRLHPYCYFLEGLTPVLDRPECAAALQSGIETVTAYLVEPVPSFVRSDVHAQLLRVSRFSRGEADALVAFQAESDDPKVDGAFLFGRRDGQLIPHANPVSTAFAMQALELVYSSPI